MKKILLSAVAIMAFGFANAQEATGSKGFSQGDIFVSGAVGYGSEKTGDNKSDQFTFSPRAGYFVTSNIAVGVKLGFTSGTTTEDAGLGGTIDVDTNTFSVGGFGRYYFTPARDFSFFGELSVGYDSSKVEPEGGEEAKVTGFNVGLAPGISYFVSDHIALEATFGLLGYKTSEPDADGSESTDTINIGANFNDINFGIIYKF